MAANNTPNARCDMEDAGPSNSSLVPIPIAAVTHDTDSVLGDSVIINTLTRGHSATVDGSSDNKRALTSENYRVQVKLVNGAFDNVLKNALIRDLNICLFSSPANSFIPSFQGCGLRFGAVWFAPDNQQSCDWLKDKLISINEKAGEFKFRIEPFSLHQTKICISIPWDDRELLKDGDVLRRLKYQNPRIPIERWRVVKTKFTSMGDRLTFCCIDDDSLRLLENDHYRMNYAFDKVFARVLHQKKSDKPS
ncbi:uncharacterized protein LOC134221347 [Armigeres subalbatus]|uniref:uncharacterized protein LOC134221347 n=1 Tax=Armigeres subalbatus TaxID=124917 RepID=UPI002ED5FDB7